MQKDEKLESILRFVKTANVIADALGVTEKDWTLHLAETVTAIAVDLVDRVWEGEINPMGAKKEVWKIKQKDFDNVSRLLKEIRSKCTIGGELKFPFTNMDGSADTIPIELPPDDIITVDNLVSSSLYRLTFHDRLVYKVLTKALLNQVRNTVGITWKYSRQSLLQGAGLLLLSVEQKELAIDSSTSSLKIRLNGEVSGEKRRKDPRIELTSENVMTAHLAGIKLPGRVQKAVRTNLGMGTVLCEAIGGALKLLDPTTTPETKRLAQQNLETALDIATSKLNNEQMSLLSHLRNANSIEMIRQIFSMVGCSLDAVLPRVDHPCIPHPIYWLSYKEADLLDIVKDAVSCYDTELLKLMNKAVVAKLEPGVRTEMALKQILMMSAITGTYGPLSALEKFFNITALQISQRNDCVDALKKKFSGTVSAIKMNSNAPKSTLHFLRGTPSAVGHQSVPHPSCKTDTNMFVVHNLLMHKSVPKMRYIEACQKLLGLLGDKNQLRLERDKWLTSAHGDLVFLSDLNRCYFNEVKDQTDQSRREVITSWMALVQSTSFGPSPIGMGFATI
jgi:hypothetical protein